MNIITDDSLADIEFQLRWKSNEAEHNESFFTKVNFWRDILPQGLYEQLQGKASVTLFKLFTAKKKNFYRKILPMKLP